MSYDSPTTERYFISYYQRGTSYFTPYVSMMHFTHDFKFSRLQIASFRLIKY